MGTEIVFVLILPIAVLCLSIAVLFWTRVSKVEWEPRAGPLGAFAPLLVGFAVSMVGLALVTYVDGDADFTSLVQQGYYTEAERSIYLPRRLVGQAIVTLIFLLPAICFVVVPLTAWLIRRGRLTFKDIGQFAIMGWLVLSLAGWLVSFGMTPRYSLLSFLVSTPIAVVLYGLPIPVAARWLLRPSHGSANSTD